MDTMQVHYKTLSVDLIMKENYPRTINSESSSTSGPSRDVLGSSIEWAVGVGIYLLSSYWLEEASLANAHIALVASNSLSSRFAKYLLSRLKLIPYFRMEATIF